MVDENEPALDPLLVLLRVILVYGTLLFACGFVFGLIRELALIPALGRTAGRTIEFAIMLAVTFALAARMAKRILPAGARRLLALGIGGAIVLAALEAMFVLYVMQLPAKTYFDQFNLLAGELFTLALLAVILAPVIVCSFIRS